MVLHQHGVRGLRGLLGQVGRLQMARGRMLAKMADALAEAGALKGGSGGAQPAVSPEQAREAVSRKYMDGEFMAAYMGSDHPGHAAAVREMEALFAAAHSGTQG